MKGANVLVEKENMVVPVAPLPLVELAKLPVKVFLGWVDELILESCLDRELLAK